MRTLDKDLAPSSWMICSALEGRQELSTVQEAPLQELVTLTPAGDIWMMLDFDVLRVCTVINTQGSRVDLLIEKDYNLENCVYPLL